MKMIINVASLCMIAAFLGGCVQSQVMMVTDTTAQVSVRGIQNTTQPELYNAAVRKAAETAKEKGFPYFTVLANEDATVVQQGYVPETSFTNKKGQTFTSGGYSYTNINPGMNVGVSFYDHNCPGCFKTEAVLKNNQ